MTSFDGVWQRIQSHAGEPFRLVGGLPFTYRVRGTSLVTSRTAYPLHRVNFERAPALMPLSGPGQISNVVRGSSYVYAILTDPRIRQGEY